jgi:hypothetical protein
MKWPTATASKSASTSSRAAGFARAAALPAALLCALLCAAPASAGLEFDRVTGHLGVGYARAFIPGSPGGSISVGAGLDYALTECFALGTELGYDLLGARDVKRDSLFGTVDYNALQFSLRMIWKPVGLGPIHRVSAGPMLFRAKGEVQTPFGGLPFDDLSVHETAPGAALDVTLIPMAERPVKLGFELGTRLAFLKSRTWSLAIARVVFHY